MRLTALLATVAAFVLVPASQALANGTMTLTIAGSGAGEVESTSTGIGEGTPAIGCTYASPGPATGVCENELEKYPGQPIWFVALAEHAAPGSEFAGWEVTEGFALEKCGSEGKDGEGKEEVRCFPGVFSETANAAVTATFCLEGQASEGGCGGGPTGPTNLRTLSLTKSAGGTTGSGSVSSKPKGIKCGATCNAATASLYKETNVELAAKPSTGSTFVEWTGACSGSAPTCTVKMTEEKEVGAVFGGVSKEVINATPLTVSKGESSGKGTVKGAGLGCEADCTATTVVYQGPITGAKPKPAKSVELTAAPAFGSKFTGWEGGGCSGTGTCVVTMNEATEVVATFTASPAGELTVTKNSYESGSGSVSSKPKGIKCGATCTEAVASIPQEEKVELSAKPSTGDTFVEWQGGDCEGQTSPTCTVTMDKEEFIIAVFAGPVKAIPSATALTLNKGGSGLGTVKAAGLGCEVLCTSTTVLYQGPITEPKPKPAKTVELSAVAAPGSSFTGWEGGGCSGTGTCVVAMNEATTVTATFDELE
jgi:Divergent InlB B-repeat domain